MSGGYTTHLRPSYHSWHSLYFTLLLLFIILGQKSTTGASVHARSGSIGSRGTELVGEDSRFCRYRRKILSCDFNWINKEVELPVRPNCREEVERIFVRHVHNLRLNQGSCYDVSLTHITSVKLEGEKVTNCLCQNFRLQNTTVESLPPSVSNLYVHESHISNISLHNILQQLTIIGSTIGEFNFSSSINSTLTVKLHSTTIDVISEFKISEPVSLFMQNCTVKNIQDGAFVLGSARNILNQLRLGGGSHSDVPVIYLKNGGDMTMENMIGVVQIKSEGNSDFDNQFEVNQINPETLIMPNEQWANLPQSNYMVTIIILVAFLIISFILNMILLLLFKQPRKFIIKLLGISNEIGKIKRNGSHKILDKDQSYESESLVISISTTESQLTKTMSIPDIIQTSDSESTPKARKRLPSLNLDKNCNNYTNSKDKLSPIKEQNGFPSKIDINRRRYKSESAANPLANLPETFNLKVDLGDKRHSQYSNSSFVDDNVF